MTKRILRGTLFGGITFFLLGWLIWGILLRDYNAANMNQCANKPMEEMVWWAIIVSNLLNALLLTLILNGSGASGIISGIKTGAVFGLLWSAAMDFSFWSMTNMFNNIGAVVVDIIANTLFMAIASMVIVLSWGKDKAS